MFEYYLDFFTPLLLLCGIAGGIFLMVTGIKYRKLFVILMGIICLSFVIMPFIFLNKGINGETILPISTTLYWILFSLTGLLAGLNGLQQRLKVYAIWDSLFFRWTVCSYLLGTYVYRGFILYIIFLSG